MNNRASAKSAATLIQSLRNTDAYAHTVTSAQLIETHISWVLLTGEYAYKIKKPVNFGFLDFSTLEKRRFYCLEELRLNQRLAANWYLAVVPITGSIDCPTMEGSGEAIEYALKMRQFPSVKTLKDCAEQGQLTSDTIDQITELIIDFHQHIEQTNEQSAFGGALAIKHWFVENFDHIRPLLQEEQPLQQLQAIEAWSQQQWLTMSPYMQTRKQEGYVRECHGDLHLGNMITSNNQVVLFDCIEFNPALRWIDVMSEVSFLMMDLIHLGYDHYAYRLLNRYLQNTGDYGGSVLLPYYLVYRALVRAKVSILRLTQNPDPAASTQARADYLRYTNLAERFTKTSPPVLMITHGFSGSGKSRFAAKLAEQLGIIQIRSDIERKRLFGYAAQAKTGSGIDTGIYTPEAGEKTYQHLVGLAKTLLAAGFSVIMDAAFLKAEQRNLFRELAKNGQVPFIIFDLQASAATLGTRIMRRQNNVSEATLEVLKQQQNTANPLCEVELQHVIQINTEQEDALAHALAELSTRGLIHEKF